MTDETRLIKLTLPSEFGYEKMAMKLAGSVAQQMGFAPERVDGVRTAVSEACLNAIEHGNQLDASTRVHVLFTVGTDRLCIDIRDEGRGGPPPEHVPDPDIHRKVTGEEDPRRMGLYVIRQLVDEAGFVEPAPDGGNRFRMVIHLQR